MYICYKHDVLERPLPPPVSGQVMIHLLHSLLCRRILPFIVLERIASARRFMRRE